MVNQTMLRIWTCFLLDNKEELMLYDNNETMLRCQTSGEYFFGKEIGLNVLLAFIVIIGIISIVGALGNVTNIVLLKYVTRNASLHSMLLLLAIFDFCVCCTAIIMTSTLLVVLGGVSREKAVLRTMFFSGGIFNLAKTGSEYLTILITIERWLVVKYPISFKLWLTRRRSLFVVSIVLLWIILINCPLLLNFFSLTKNKYYNREPVTSFSKFPYVYDETWFSKAIFHKLLPWNTIFDTVLPVPLLLAFNAPLYFEIHKANKNRTNLNSSQCNEVKAAQVFFKIAVVLFVCNCC
ncbi:hypothetical protein HA402_005959, partial [Bradysia odoriphaga]